MRHLQSQRHGATAVISSDRHGARVGACRHASMHALVFGSLAAIAVPAIASDRCEPQWHSGVAFGELGSVVGFATLPDAGGERTFLAGGGGAAEWDDTTWNVLGTETLLVVRGIITFDDGDGPAI